MEKIDPTFFGFLVSCIMGMGTFIFWLVKKIILLTSDCSETMKDVRNAVVNNTGAITELRATMMNLKK